MIVSRIVCVHSDNMAYVVPMFIWHERWTYAYIPIETHWIINKIKKRKM